jgi:hypothetical protein
MTCKQLLRFITRFLRKPSQRALFFYLTLLTLLPLQTAKSDCGIGGRAAQHYSFVHLDLLAWQSDYAPYLMGYQVIHDIYQMQKRDPQYDDNIMEWRDRFCDVPDSAHIDELLYYSSVDELTDLRDAASRRGRDIHYRLHENTFAQVLKENGCTETIDYLIYAKECEKYCVVGESWDDKRPLSADMFFLINRGRTEFRRTESQFLRMRYAYQMLRLAHYAKDYEAVLRIWDDLIPKITKVRSIINYWALAHRAGALKALGRRAEAAYYFAVVFRYCPSKRRQAFQSFDIRTDAEWRECLNFCKTPQERAALYAIRASYDKAHALDDLVELYKLDPRNEHLDMLLIRETLRMEKILLGSDFRRARFDDRTIKNTQAYLAKLTQFAKTVADQDLVAKTTLWRTTEGYLRLLSGDWRRALTTLYQAQERASGDALMQEQIQNYALAARVIGLQNVDAQMDSTVNVIRASTTYAKDPDFEPFLLEKLGAVFRQQNNLAAAFLCDMSLGDLASNPKLELVDALIELCRKPNKTQIERELVTEGGRTIEPQLWDIKGMYHLSRFQLEAALQAFGNIPPERREKKYNPFADRLNDCLFKCTTSDTFGLMDKYSFTQQMLDLHFKSNAALEQGAAYHYKLALGYYNMTYFGNSWGLADGFRDWRTWTRINQGKAVFPAKNNPMGNIELLDCAVARQHFEQARILWWNIDREMSARAAFWVAKCDQNLFFVSTENRYKTGSPLVPDLPPQYRSYFDLLRNHYAQTNFYQTARTECKYFRFYTNR